MSVHLVHFKKPDDQHTVVEKMCTFVRKEIEKYDAPRAVAVLILDNDDKITIRTQPLVRMDDNAWIGVFARVFHIGLMENWRGVESSTDDTDAS